MRGGSVQLGGGSVQPGRGGVSPARGVGQSAGGQGGGVSQDRTTQGVLATRWAVCLLRSRRRTFLFINDLNFLVFI